MAIGCQSDVPGYLGETGRLDIAPAWGMLNINESLLAPASLQHVWQKVTDISPFPLPTAPDFLEFVKNVEAIMYRKPTTFGWLYIPETHFNRHSSDT